MVNKCIFFNLLNMLTVRSKKNMNSFVFKLINPNVHKMCVTDTHCSVSVCRFTHSSSEWIMWTATLSPLHSQTAFMKMKSHSISIMRLPLCAVVLPQHTVRTLTPLRARTTVSMPAGRLVCSDVRIHCFCSGPKRCSYL